MLKRSTVAMLAGLLQNSLPWILIMWNNSAWASRNQQTVARDWILSQLKAKFARKWVWKFLISHTTVTLNEDQLSKPYQNVEFSGLNHNTKFERNQPLNVQIQANAHFYLFYHFFLSSLNKVKWVWGSSDQQISTVCHIPSKLIENFVR